MKAIALAAAIGMVSGMAVTKPGLVGWAKHKVASMVCSGASKCTPEQMAAKQAQCAAKQAQCAPKACCKK